MLSYKMDTMPCTSTTPRVPWPGLNKYIQQCEKKIIGLESSHEYAAVRFTRHLYQKESNNIRTVANIKCANDGLDWAEETKSRWMEVEV